MIPPFLSAFDLLIFLKAVAAFHPLLVGKLDQVVNIFGPKRGKDVEEILSIREFSFGQVIWEVLSYFRIR